MAVSLSSPSSSTITPITLNRKLTRLHGFRDSKVSFFGKFSIVSLRRNAVAVSAITGASGTADLLESVKVLDLRGIEILISDLLEGQEGCCCVCSSVLVVNAVWRSVLY